MSRREYPYVGNPASAEDVPTEATHIKVDDYWGEIIARFPSYRQSPARIMAEFDLPDPPPKGWHRRMTFAHEDICGYETPDTDKDVTK